MLEYSIILLLLLIIFLLILVLYLLILNVYLKILNVILLQLNFWFHIFKIRWFLRILIILKIIIKNFTTWIILQDTQLFICLLKLCSFIQNFIRANLLFAIIDIEFIRFIRTHIILTFIWNSFIIFFKAINLISK
jgi:hypothetical protein